MTTHSIKTRLLAIFVVAFVCLNAGGGMCVAYCRTVNTVESDYCPLKKTSAHCGKSKDRSAGTHVTAVDSSEFDYCPMTVTFFAGPIEKKSFSFSQVSQGAVVRSETQRPYVSFASIFTASFDYRGPPLLDRRVERLKHQLLRI